MVTVCLSGEGYLSTNEPSRFSREFKLEALRRMEAGANVSDLARQLGVSRKSIYQWRNRYRLGGSKALRGRGRMTNADLSAHEERPAVEKQPGKEARRTSNWRSWPGRNGKSLRSNVRSASNKSSSIFFSKPCGKSGINACGAAGLAGRHLRSHPSDDDVSVARRYRNRAH